MAELSHPTFRYRNRKHERLFLIQGPRHDELYALVEHTFSGLDLIDATLAKGEVINFLSLVKRRYAKKADE